MVSNQNLIVRVLLRNLFLGLILCHSCPSKGQIPYTYFGPGQGLSANLVTDITKDSMGYLWLATSKGLNRFDGYSFRTFGPGTTPPGTLSARYISSIGWTHDKKLLLIYRNNVDFFELFDPKTFRVNKVNLYPANGVQGSVRMITCSAQGHVYVLSQLINATHIYRYEAGDTLKLVANISQNDSRISRIDRFIPLPGGHFLINDLTQGIFLFHAEGYIKPIKHKQLLTDPVSKDLSANTTIFHYSKHRDLSYISFEGLPYLFTYDHHVHSFQRVAGLDILPHMECTYLWEDQQGNLLLSQTNGQGTYPISERLLFLPVEGPAKDWSFLTQVTKYIVSLYADDFKTNLFLGADTGLKIHYNTQFRQKAFLAQNLAPDEFGAVMRGITSDGDSSVFLAREFSYWYQINEYTGKLDTIRIRRTSDRKALDFKCSFDLLFSPPNSIWGIACDGNGKGLLIRYNIKNETARVFEFEHRFQDLLQVANGFIWLITNSSSGSNTLVRFDPSASTFKEYRTSEGNNPFSRYTLNCIAQGNEKQLWIGTNRGLLRFQPEEEKLDILTREQALISNAIQTIYFDRQEQMWIGTSDGITLLDQNGTIIRNYTTEQGLCNNNISSIVEDHLGNVWVSTANGLSVLLPEALEFRSYYYTDGFPSDNFVTNSALMSGNGYLYLGTVNGFTRFQPKELLYQIELPAPQISVIRRYDIASDSVKTNALPLSPNDVIKLQPEDDYLDLSFFLPFYQAPGKNTFRIKMVPLESDWNELGTLNTFRYQRIPPGNYTIHLQGSAPSGQWSPKVTKLNLQVLPHWYETTWAYIGLIVVVLILLYMLFQYRLRQKLKVAQLRTKISSDIHDEVSGLLSGIAMQSDLLLESTINPQQQERLKKIGQVSRKAVSQIHDVLWSIDSRKDHLGDLINRMQEHAEDVLIPRGIFFDIRQVNIDPRKRLRVTIRQNVFFIYKEAINNIAKHSDANKVIIRLERQRNQFTMTILDNGKTQAESPARTGQGIENMYMRAERINGKLSIVSEKGYQVRLTIPKF